MLVYIIRHGESENNLGKLWTGWYDAPLTELGMRQAETVGDTLRGIAFDKIYSSDLQRAEETAKAVIPNCEYESTELLREIKMGSLENQPLSVFGKDERQSYSQIGYAEFGGETQAGFLERISKFKKMLEALDCEAVAVFTHAGWLRAFLSQIIGAPVSSKNVCCKNCTVGVFEFESSNWRLHSWINAR